MQEKTLHEIEKEAWSQRAESYDAIFASISSQAIRDILDSLGGIEGKRHLDVACGTGHLVAAASQRGAASEGVDFAEPMIDAAQATYPGLPFKVADATQLPYEDRSFDAVTCAFGLSHMEEPQAAVNESFRVLKPGGWFAFTLWFDGKNGNDLFRIVNDAFAIYALDSFTLPESWTQLRYADEQACENITRKAGFSTPLFKKIPIAWLTTSAQQSMDLTEKLSVRSKMIIERQAPAIQGKIYEHIRSKVAALRVDGMITLAWPALLTVVQKSYPNQTSEVSK
jgi:ubiquinone/menaquinone biosynthesis C-methylase UbiE